MSYVVLRALANAPGARSRRATLRRVPSEETMKASKRPNAKAKERLFDVLRTPENLRA